MARERRPEDWERDLAAAKQAEAEFKKVLATDDRLIDVTDHTGSFDRLDFSFTYEGAVVQVDLKEKIRQYSAGLAALWPEVAPEHLFVLDETVYRRIVWHGGGGYLVVHDHPQKRWAIFGPWELTLGPRARYVRWGRRGESAFPKGKIMLDLRAGASSSEAFSVDHLIAAIAHSRKGLELVEAVEIPGQTLPEIGRP
jgi:hypothetical protein